MKLVPCPKCGHKNNPGLGSKIRFTNTKDQDSILLVCRGRNCNEILYLTLLNNNYSLKKKEEHDR